MPELVAAAGTLPVQLVPRKQWDARPWTRRADMRLDNVAGIVLHHTVTEQRGNLEQIVRSVQAYHMDGRGWSDIAYNFLIGADGRVFEGRGWANESGATGKKNLAGEFLDDADKRFYSVCFIGDYSTLPEQKGHTLSEPQVEAFRRLRVNYLMAAKPEAGAVVTHNQFKATACPGENVTGSKDRLMRLPQSPVASLPDPEPSSVAPQFRLELHDIDAAIAHTKATLQSLRRARKRAS